MADVASLLQAQSGPDPVRAMGIVALNGMFDEQDAAGVIRMATEELLTGNLAVVSSFGADSVTLLHLVASINPDLPVFFLDTGKHFDETVAYVDELKEALGLTDVRTLVPSSDDLKRFDPDGELWESDPDSCCHIRKTEPLNEALASFGGWITGRKRFQTSDRGVLPHFELTSDDRIKVNPLAYWHESDISAYKARYDLPEHPLVAEGYASIGCAPCTSAVKDGEDARAGRWRGLNKAECGIHFDFNGQIARPRARDAMTLFKDGKFIVDPFSPFGEDDKIAEARYQHVPLRQIKEQAEEFAPNPHPVGLLVSPDDRIEDVADLLDRFSSIAVEFPAFTDGRGYSTVRLLRERYGYEGEIRAVGDVLLDQINFMRRCGVSAFKVTNEATKSALEKGVQADISVYMQPVGGHAIPDGTRPFLRRA